MTRIKAVRLHALATRLAALDADGYGDCPIYLETTRDIGPLVALIYRQRGNAFYLSEITKTYTALEETVCELPKTEKGEAHE